MKLSVDTDARTLSVERDDGASELPLYSTEAFEAISELWLKVGWNQKYTYTFSWLGRPVVQLPDDLVRMQELVTEVQPDLIVECGIAHGGSLVYYASLCRLLGKGRVVGVDVEIRPHNRAALEAHPLSDRITLLEGSSVDQEIVSAVAAEIGPHDRVLVVLDSAHNRDHVLAELEAYAPFVSPGSYVVAMDGIMRLVSDTPRGQPEWSDDNPIAAVEAFLAGHPEFELEQPARPFDESELRTNVTHSPSGFLRRRG